MARILRFWDEGRIEVAGAARLLAARRDGPVLVAGLHLGNPEVLGLTLARLGLRPVGVATRQPTDVPRAGRSPASACAAAAA